jgi:hypothetical protein
VNNELILMGLARRQHPSLAATVLPPRSQTAYSAGIGAPSASGQHARARQAPAPGPWSPRLPRCPHCAAAGLGEAGVRTKVDPQRDTPARPRPRSAACTHRGPASHTLAGSFASTCGCFSDK